MLTKNQVASKLTEAGYEVTDNESDYYLYFRDPQHDGLILHIYLENKPGQPTKGCVYLSANHVKLPRNSFVNTRAVHAHKICFSLEKSASEIKRDIDKRFLPEAIQLWEAFLENCEKDAKRIEAQDALVKWSLEKLGSPNSVHDNGHVRYVTNPYINEIDCNREDVHIICRLPHELAGIVFDAIALYTKEQKEKNQPTK